ncbi:MULTISPECIES: SSI family serine proteinase inhibitor [unclassified Blastococcus]
MVLVALAALAGCADRPDGGDAGSPATGAAPADELTVAIDRGDGSPAEEYTLSCAGGPRGTLPDPRAACEHLAALDAPFAPLPADVVCTEQYGGPQTARVTGRWAGEDVDLALSRTDGCRIAQWDSLGPLLPGPVGVLD